MLTRDHEIASLFKRDSVNVKNKLTVAGIGIGRNFFACADTKISDHDLTG